MTLHPGAVQFVNRGSSLSASLDSGRQSRFRYRAACADGRIETGVLVASSRDAAALALEGRGWWVLDVKAMAVDFPFRRSMSHRDLALGLRLLATLLESEMPIARALAALEDLAPEGWRSVLPGMRAAVERGETLGHSLAEAPLGLPAVAMGIIQAGEAGPGLSNAVRRAATMMESVAATRAAIANALAYPALLASAGVAAVAILVGVVLPRFAAILSDLGQALPPTTAALIAGAQLIRQTTIPAFLALAAGLVVWLRWKATPTGRTDWHLALLEIPVIGETRRAAATAQYSRALSALLQCGVPIANALQLAAQASGDAALEARLDRARSRVIQGDLLSASLSAEGAVTPTALRLVRAGEQSGRLVEMLEHAALLEQERAERRVKAVVRFLEPGLIIGFGALVAFVAAALLQAVYSVRPTP